METKDILKNLRKNKGYNTMQDFCSAIGISFSTYQNYETGKRIPTADMLVKLADFYGVTTDYLLGREPVDNPFAFGNMLMGEEEMLEKYLSLPEHIRKMIIMVMEDLASNKEAKEKPRAYDEYTLGEIDDMKKAEQDAG